MTIIKSIEEITIFESPDGGKTVYARKSGETERTLIREDPDKKDRDRWLEWRDILEASKDNTALADLIQKAETIWHLTKNP
jgi:hypothetical protein